MAPIFQWLFSAGQRFQVIKTRSTVAATFPDSDQRRDADISKLAGAAFVIVALGALAIGAILAYNYTGSWWVSQSHTAQILLGISHGALSVALLASIYFGYKKIVKALQPADNDVPVIRPKSDSVVFEYADSDNSSEIEESYTDPLFSDSDNT